MARHTNENARIYVADLAAYTAGLLRGAWIDLDLMTSSELEEALTDLRDDWRADVETNSTYGINGQVEEMSIHDHEGIPFSGEPSITEVKEWLDTLEDLSDYEPDAISAYVEAFGEMPTADDMCDQYRGEYDSETDFAWEFLDDMGEAPDGLLARYFDIKAYARDLFISDFIMEGGHVFFRY